TTSWREAIDDPDVDIVDIVTPNFLHKDVAIAAAKASKHIWCEKPLALTAEDAVEMTKAAEEEAYVPLPASYLRVPVLLSPSGWSNQVESENRSLLPLPLRSMRWRIR